MPYCILLYCLNVKKFYYNILYYGARLWNQLPVKERRIEEYTNF